MEKKCVICGSVFETNDETRECCSPECARKKSGITSRKMRVCEYCGNEFWKPNGHKIHYCSEDCKKKAFSEKHPKKIKIQKTYKRICSWCLSDFETNNKDQMYCSKECLHEGNLRDHRIKWMEDYKSKKYICKECGTEFETECGNTHSVFCCDACAKIYEKRKERHTDRHKKALAKQKITRDRLIKENFVEPVDYRRIFERDKGKCQICGMPVLVERSENSDWSGTIDHIIPLSKGGEHSMENCQLAHRICNSLKGIENECNIDWNLLSSEDLYWKRKLELYKEST